MNTQTIEEQRRKHVESLIGTLIEAQREETKAYRICTFFVCIVIVIILIKSIGIL